MDRRKYLKTLAAGTVSTAVLLDACTSPEKVSAAESVNALGGPDRQPHETEHFKKVSAERFFDDHEMATIAVLANLIIPKDEVSGSATEAGVPDFIEFIAKDMPRHQTPLRGGLKWLDLHCLRRYNRPFVNCDSAQQTEMADAIAYPDQASPDMQPGVAFFNLMRDLTATGFYTSEMGIKDLGYLGNRPNQWDGVPQDVLDQHGLQYDARTLDISVKFDA